jgi:hypothetical protein
MGGNKSMEWGAPSAFWLLALVLVVALFGFFIVWVRWQGPVTQAKVAMPYGGSDLLVSTTSIRTRADVVRAFHQLAFRIAHPIESWWTPHRVASRVDSRSPDVRSALHVAVDVYEQSRYLPDNEELTEEQLVHVREAIHTLDAHAKSEFLGNAKGNDRAR